MRGPRKPLKRIRKRGRRNTKAWTARRAAIGVRDSYQCGMCGAKHPKATAHHVWPSGPDHETNMIWIGLAFPSGNGASGCHSAAHHDLRASKATLGRKLTQMYGVESEAAAMIAEGIEETAALRSALDGAMARIKAGAQPSLVLRVASLRGLSGVG